MTDPTDEQKIIIHILKEAWKRGAEKAWVTRTSLLDGKTVPKAVGVKLVWAALTLPTGLLDWSADEKEFRIKERFIEMSKQKEICYDRTPKMQNL